MELRTEAGTATPDSWHPRGGPERVEGMRIIDKVADRVIEVETEGIILLCKARIGDVPLPGQGLEANDLSYWTIRQRQET